MRPPTPWWPDHATRGGPGPGDVACILEAQLAYLAEIGTLGAAR